MYVRSSIYKKIARESRFEYGTATLANTARFHFIVIIKLNVNKMYVYLLMINLLYVG